MRFKDELGKKHAAAGIDCRNDAVGILSVNRNEEHQD